MKLRLSLRTQWILALLLGGTLPLALLAVATVSIQRDGLSVAEKDLELAAIDQVGEATEHLLQDAAEATHRVGALLADGRIGDDEARLSLARETLARCAALGEVAIYAPGGALIDAIRQKNAGAGPAPLPQVPKEVLAPPWAAWLPPTFARGDAPVEAPVEAIVRRVEPLLSPLDDGLVPRGFVIGTLAAGALSQRVAEISMRRFGRQDRVLLLSPELRVMAGPGLAQGSLAVGSTPAGTDLFAALEGALSKAGKRRVDLAGLGLSTEFTAADGEPMVGTLRVLKNELLVAVRRPQREAFEALGRSRRAFLLSGAFFLLLSIGVGAFLAARTTRPVRALVELTRAYARRDFTRRSPVRSGDELEQLGEAMAQMADDLLKSEVELSRRQVVEANLSRYLPGEVARAIAAGKQPLQLGGRREIVTALFADVVSFTPFAESAPPEQVVAFLNELFTVLTEVVFRHGGTVDKFMGDCIMALFGAVQGAAGEAAGEDDHAARALLCAEDMHRFVESTSPAWQETYGVEIRLGIGVSSGEALVGNLGSETRMEFTAIGDVVNVAARLEAMARPGQTLLSAEVAARCGDAFTFRSLGRHLLHGKQREVEILEAQ